MQNVTTSTVKKLATAALISTALISGSAQAHSGVDWAVPAGLLLIGSAFNHGHQHQTVTTREIRHYPAAPGRGQHGRYDRGHGQHASYPRHLAQGHVHSRSGYREQPKGHARSRGDDRGPARGADRGHDRGHSRY